MIYVVNRSVKIHAKSKEHVSTSVQLSTLGNVRIEHLIDEGASIQLAKRNETVHKIREIIRTWVGRSWPFGGITRVMFSLDNGEPSG